MILLLFSFCWREDSINYCELMLQFAVEANKKTDLFVVSGVLGLNSAHANRVHLSGKRFFFLVCLMNDLCRERTIFCVWNTFSFLGWKILFAYNSALVGPSPLFWFSTCFLFVFWLGEWDGFRYFDFLNGTNYLCVFVLWTNNIVHLSVISAIGCAVVHATDLEKTWSVRVLVLALCR